MRSVFIQRLLNITGNSLVPIITYDVTPIENMWLLKKNH